MRPGPWALALVLAAPGPALAQAAEPAPPVASLAGVVVVGPTPVPGAGIDRDRAPVETIVLDSATLTRAGEPDALRALQERVGAVSLDSASGNPYQPTLIHHGFQASPLQGVSQGLAVYVDGARFNQPFGDTVNWDLIPAVAIDRLTLEGANPAFGLNALGGSIAVALKSAFTFKGGEADVAGGAFGQGQGDGQFGARFGQGGVYVAGSIIHQGGWRDLQGSNIQNLYADLAWQDAVSELHLAARAANSDLNGPGTSPAPLLAVAPRAQFTAPNDISNQNAALSFRANRRLDDTASIQASAAYAHFRQTVTNGNAPNDVPCDDGGGLLCSDAGVSTTTNGAAIAAFRGPSPLAYAQLDNQTTVTDSFGGAVQLTDSRPWRGLGNHMTAGASFDGARTRFSAASYVGGISADTRVFVGPGAPIDEPGVNSPVRLDVADASFGAFAADTLDLTERLSLTASGRFNRARIDLHDRLGGDLSGDHVYGRFNPAIGAAWRGAPWLTVYGGYAETNRAPTPAELSCAAPTQSCSLANFFVGDPDLKQVAARTVEAGARGQFGSSGGPALRYSLAVYRSDLVDDIVMVNSPALNRAFFTNIARTRRQGVDADVSLSAGRVSAYAAYAHTEATFQSGFVEAGGAHPLADANGDLTIRPGDRFAGVPRDQLKLGFDIRLTDRLSAGATGVGQGPTYLFGDEANLAKPLPGFFILNLRASYQLTRRLEVFGRIDNATNRTYYSYGAFSPTASVYLAQAPGATNPRSYSPAAPIGAFGGVRWRF